VKARLKSFCRRGNWKRTAPAPVEKKESEKEVQQDKQETTT
jgi:hypothetical protein